MTGGGAPISWFFAVQKKFHFRFVSPNLGAKPVLGLQSSVETVLRITGQAELFKGLFNQFFRLFDLAFLPSLPLDRWVDVWMSLTCQNSDSSGNTSSPFITRHLINRPMTIGLNTLVMGPPSWSA